MNAARLIAAVFDKCKEGKGERAALEMPSGSGKTLAYLVPMLFSDSRVMLSTATLQLQNQLATAVLPKAMRALRRHKSMAVLKGRQHYYCPYFADKALASGRMLANRQREVRELASRCQKMLREDAHDLSQVIPAHIAAEIGCSQDECLERDCPSFSRCPYYLSRRRARQADILVVNHALLLREQASPWESLWDERAVIIVDEAHQLDHAHDESRDQISSSLLMRFGRDGLAALKQDAPDATVVIDQLRRWNDALGRLLDHPGDNMPFAAIIAQWCEAIHRLAVWFDRLAERSLALREMSVRAGRLRDHFDVLAGEPEHCVWVTMPRAFYLRRITGSEMAPGSDYFADREQSMVFLSATLSIAGFAGHFLRCAGVGSEHFHVFPAVFDWSRQACLFTPVINAERQTEAFYRDFSAEVIAMLDRCDGRVLMLFSSFRALAQTASRLLTQGGRRWLVQGAMDNSALVDAFIASDKAVLLATGAFWEGVDLSGVPLRGVIIDKLPFAAPDSAPVKQRAALLQQWGVDSFQTDVLPRAILRLRQGVGRLLRRLSDYGFIMLADSRIDTQAYGKQFLDSLPPMQRFFYRDEVVSFLEQASSANTRHPISSQDTNGS